jgi:probable DNA repair protein
VRGSEAQQTLLRFNELLDEFGELALAARVMSRERALQIFSELAARTRFRPASGDALVTVTGRLEDPVVRYDGIWIAGMDATSWPEPVQLNPFLAQAAQRAAGIPAASAEGRTAAARALMLAWRAAANDLVFSVATRDEDLELLPSALLREWQSDAPTPADPGLWLPLRLRRANAVESLTDAVAPAWPAAVRLPSGTRLLELQSLCAFRAFGELRLNSRLLDEPTPGVAPPERGQFLHAALEAFWKTLRDWESLQALSADALAAQQLWGGTRTRAQARESRRARELLRAVCELERTREPFRVRDTELPASVSLAGRRLDLRIDRVDSLSTGGLAILDYKSGTHRKMDWYGEHLSHPQLLAYLLALDEDVRAVATVNVAVRDVGFHGIGVAQGLLPKLHQAVAPQGLAQDRAWDESREFWRQRLDALARDFLDGRAEVDPAPNACKYCDVASLCRIADRAAASADEDAQGVSDD